ncbi:amidase [Neoasaia chiangmaiensis]|uniref:Amidase n=1 Tax=Neoasaia chiangmaiensis TaxID=320497 RepID=A0A1U9KUJ7_9PROT|nr:amidase [Neoasaia chiangmaiensis]
MTQRSCLKSRRRPIFSSLTILSLLLTMAMGSQSAEARHRFVRHANFHHTRFVARRHYSVGHVIQCVAFAKTASDVILHGNAADWWYNARGVYARGAAPEPGSVLNFRATRRMPLGHVAVVKEIQDSRTIVIDQSHWAQRGISRNVHVIDVSPNNDWSAVRVALNGRSEDYGSIYPTYGFIYGRPDNGVMMASNTPVQATVQPAFATRRVATHRAIEGNFDALRHPMASTEVAEAPDDAFAIDAPNRNIR